ncbi:MAG: 50S ribosomal protein L32 [Chloroflexi bacterium]|nr:50S ribosomal protein L32 [Ktedonobacteraceae bacterium]MBV9021967.1 50S ribosomal protein L32 [Ktedonobacteraceae bacterium]MBV9707847.1 50S ribosomal protein L32 [Chloroflexota bacterium]
MGALPKQRVSPARQGKRRSHHHLDLPKLVECQQCKRPRLSHHACPHCGWYRNRQVFTPKAQNR